MQPNDPLKLSLTQLKDYCARLKRYCDNQNKGALYQAIATVGEKHGRPAELFLKKHGIYQDGSLKEDLRALEVLGLPSHIFAHEPGWIIREYTRREDFPTVLIMAAATIILLFIRDQVAQAPSGGTPEPPRRETYSRHLTLALVLKGTDLAEWQLEDELLVEQVLDMLDRASYFTCTMQPTMEAMLQHLALEVGQVDRTSKQPVFVAIQFQHDSPMQQSETFETKRQLRQFLRQGNNQFQLKIIRNVRVSNLTEFGFIRT